MKRRSFLAMIGLAPAVATSPTPTAATVAPARHTSLTRVEHVGSITRVTILDSDCVYEIDKEAKTFRLVKSYGRSI